MDPLSISGIAVGAPSLVIQVFDECLKVYGVFAAAVGMPQDCSYMAVRLEVEYGRLKKWGHVAGFGDGKDGASISASIRTNRLPIVAILTEIQILMTSFARISGKYVELRARQAASSGGDIIEADEKDLADAFGSVGALYESPDLDAPKGFLQKSISIVKDTKGVIRHPRRLKWVLFHKDKFIELLRRLQQLNDSLHELMDDHQLEMLRRRTEDTYLEMVQVRNGVDDLKQLIEAAKSSEPSQTTVSLVMSDWAGHSNMPSRRQDEVNLTKLAKFKLLNAEIATHATTRQIRIPVSDVRLEASQVRIGRVEAIYAPKEESERCVWIEWKEYMAEDQDDKTQNDKSQNNNTESEPEALKRVKELAALLTSPKPEEFCIPPCLGFLDLRRANRSKGHAGFVFENPDAAPAGSRRVSIREAIVLHKKPSLTDRVQLAHRIATCILYLHSVNWLHKGIRSDNILCFSDNYIPKFTAPYLTGFDYSRPSRVGEGTEATPILPAWEIYRHPDIQGDGPRPYYRKTFDIYSLGIVLLEIAFWRPIEKIMSIEDITKASQATTRHVREQLLTTAPVLLETLRSEAGNLYHNATKFCIGGRDSFGIAKDNLETSPQTGVLLQQRFQEEVVRKLKSLVI